MLTCPLCNKQISEREMQEGRCPECMALFTWEGYQTETPAKFPIEEEFPSAEPAQEPSKPDASEADRVAELLKPAEKTNYIDSPDPSAPPPPANVPSESEPQAPFASTPQESTDDQKYDASKTDPEPESTTNPDVPAADSGARSLGLEQTLQGMLSEEQQSDTSLVRTIAPRELTGDQEGAISDNWSTYASDADVEATLNPNSRPPGSSSSLVVKQRSLAQYHESVGDGTDYEMMEVIGEGGVGVVYAARQGSIDRTVALKMLRSSLAAHPEYRQKFLAEAVVIGDLDHPNIVPIYDLGKDASESLFYTMKRVEGTPWSDRIDKNSLSENLDILIKICDATAFAHSRGVIHRDLKPDNIMLGGFGEVLLMDWGISIVTSSSAKFATVQGASGLGGTPAYMAPEMVTGPVEEIDYRSDVYLLGAQLFRMLTGKPPHRGKDVKECVRNAARNLLQGTDQKGELMEIALKAMATNPNHRYASALEFRDALKGYEAHAESIRLTERAEQELDDAGKSGDYQQFARAVFGFEESTALWEQNDEARRGRVRACEAYARSAMDNGDYDLGISLLDRKEPSHLPLLHKLEAAQTERNARQRQLQRTKLVFRWTVTSFFIAMGVACVAIYVQMIKANQATVAAEGARQELAGSNRDLQTERDKLFATKKVLVKRQTQLVEEKKKSDEARQEALASKEQADIARRKTEEQSYLSQIALAAEKIDENRFDEARDILDAYRGSYLAGWEWGYLDRACNLAEANVKLDSPLQSTDASPDGRWIAVAADDGQVHIWRTAAFQTGGAEETIPQAGAAPPITAMAFSPDSRLLAVGDGGGRIRILKISPEGRLEWSDSIEVHSQAITALRFSYRQVKAAGGGASRWLLMSSEDRTATIWDLDSGAPIDRLVGHSREVRDIAMTDDRSVVVTAGEDDRVLIWTDDASRLGSDESAVALLGRIGATGSRFKLWKTVYWMHDGAVLSLDVTRREDGGVWVASGGQDGSLRLWNADGRWDQLVRSSAESPGYVVQRRQLNAAVRCVRFCRFTDRSAGHTDLHLISCGDDRTIRLWDIAPDVLDRPTASAKSAAILEKTFRGHGGRVNACRLFAATPGGTESSQPLVVSVGEDQRVMLWDVDGYRENILHQLPGGANVLDAEYGPGSRDAAYVTADGRLGIIDLKSNKLNETLAEGHDYLANRGLLLPPQSGETLYRLVTAGIDGKVIVWDLARGTSIREFDQTGLTSVIAVSPDRRWLVTGGTDNTAVLRPMPGATPGEDDPTTRTIRLTGHSDAVTAAAFVGDGRWIVTGDQSGELRVWPVAVPAQDVEMIAAVHKIRMHREQITSIVFSPFTRQVITTSKDQSIRFWELDYANGALKPLDSLNAPGEAMLSALSSDGRQLAYVRREYRARNSANGQNANDGDEAEIQSSITVRDLESGREILWDGRRDQPILSAQFVPGRTWLIIVEPQGRIELWDWKRGETNPLLAESASRIDWASMQQSGDRMRLVTMGGREIKLWDFDPVNKSISLNPTVVGPDRLMGPHFRISKLSWSPDGRWIVTGDLNGNVKIWSRDSGNAEIRLPVNSNRSIVAAQFSPVQSDRLLTAWEDRVVLWTHDGDAWNPKPEKTIETEFLSCASFSPSGEFLFVGRKNGTCQIWSGRDLSLAATLEGPLQHRAAVNCGVFTDDETTLATGSDDKNVRGLVWKKTDDGWSAVARIAGHSAGITSLAFSPQDQRRLASASRDGTAKLWDVSHWTRRHATDDDAAAGDPAADVSRPHLPGVTEILTLRGHEREVTSVRFDLNGDELMTASRDGRIIRWRSVDIAPSVVADRESETVAAGASLYPLSLFELYDPDTPGLGGWNLDVNLRIDDAEPGERVESLSFDTSSLADAGFTFAADSQGETELLRHVNGRVSRLGTLSTGTGNEHSLSPQFALAVDPSASRSDILDFLRLLEFHAPADLPFERDVSISVSLVRAQTETPEIKLATAVITIQPADHDISVDTVP